jgi:catechol 2,3-dioxygenase-like lactoylglutathione lyase family enzyme
LVTDFPACFRFYRDVLGLTSEFGDESGVYADFAVGHAKIALFKRELMAESVSTSEKPADADSQDRAAVIVAVPDVDVIHETLDTRGASFVNLPHDRSDWGVRCLHLRDPDGNLIEINHEIPFEAQGT